MTNEQKVGLIYEEPHANDYTICMAYEDSSDVEVPANFRLDFQPPQTKQLCGNCVAQSLANIMEVMYYNHTGKHEDFSIGFIYGNRFTHENQGEGMTGYMACDHLISDGDIKAKLFENPGSAPSIIKKVNEFKSANPNWKDYTYVPLRYIRTKSASEAKKFVMKYKVPVMTATNTIDYSWQSGMHAMPLIGWKNDNTAIMQNSWGDDKPLVELPFEKIQEFWMVMPFELNPFTDVTEKHWAYKSIMKCVDNKIMLGYPDNTFKPNNNITRAEFCSIIYRYLKSKKEI